MPSRYIHLLLFSLLQPLLLPAQEKITVRNGSWSAPSTWSDQAVPTPENSVSVIVAHEVGISGGETVFIDNMTITGRLEVAPEAELHIVDGDSTDLAMAVGGVLDVYGTVIGHDSISFEGMTAANTHFQAGSVYRHLATKEGNIPVAQWDPNSTFEIRDFSGGAYMNSPDWGQTFGNLVYDCPGQGAFVEFRGHLKSIAGDFTILSTNSNILKLSGSEQSTLDVGGDILIVGISEVWFSTTGNCAISVGGDFQYKSTSTASSYFTTTGQANVSVNGDFRLDAQHRFKMASGTSTGHTHLILSGDAHLLNGRLDALENGSGTVVFNGSEPQHVFATPAAEHFEGNISYRIEPGADVDLHQSLLTNTTGGDVIIEGTIRLGSANEGGIIQAGGEGNIQVAGSVIFGEASQVIINGGQAQHLGFQDLNTDVILVNPSASGVALRSDVQFGNLTVSQGRFNTAGHTARLAGNLTTEGNGKIAPGMTLEMNGDGGQMIDVRGDTLQHILVGQESAGTVHLASPLYLSGTLAINSPGSEVISGGNLYLLSASEEGGATASIGRLPAGSAVTGDVTVQRFIRGAPGDHYRYISSPVTNASVASLMDDVPVTGTFSDADSGPGLPENAPSLFYYNEEAAQWEPFPVSGLSTENYFEPGKGYSFFNWNEGMDTNWDVTGVITQGPVAFGLTYTPSVDPQLSGWNLIGNPYPAAVRWDSAGWLAWNVSPSIAVRDDLSGSFRYWDGQAGSLPGGLIASGQAFWVRTVGPEPSLIISEGTKAADGAEYYRTRAPDFLELTVSMGGLRDKAYLRIRKHASERLDEFDAPKLENDSLSVSFRTADNVRVAIDAIPELSYPLGIPLAIDAGNGSQDVVFEINAAGIFREASFSIADTVTGQTYDLGSPVTIAGHADLSALRLVIEPGTSLVTALTDFPEKGDRVAAFPVPCKEFLRVTYADGNPVVGVYTIAGKQVTDTSIHREEGGCLIDLSRVPPGSYIVRIGDDGNPVIIRIVKE